jgi:hypothetical protein
VRPRGALHPPLIRTLGPRSFSALTPPVSIISMAGTQSGALPARTTVGLEFKPNEVALAKLGNYPAWPCIVRPAVKRADGKHSMFSTTGHRRVLSPTTYSVREAKGRNEACRLRSLHAKRGLVRHPFKHKRCYTHTSHASAWITLDKMSKISQRDIEAQVAMVRYTFLHFSFMTCRLMACIEKIRRSSERVQDRASS